MKIIPKIYADQTSCFWLGFLATGLTMAFYLTFLATLNSLVSTNIKPTVSFFVTVLLQKAFAAAIFTFAFGYFLRDIQPQSERRWIWLSLVLPFCATLLMCYQTACAVELGNFYNQDNPFHINRDIFSVAIILLLSAFSSGAALVTISLVKYIGRFVRPRPTELS